MKKIIIYCELICIVVLLWVVDYYVLGSRLVMTTVCKYLPQGSTKSLGPLFANEKLLYRIHTVSTIDLEDKLVVFLGSSSVASGVNENIIREIFTNNGVDKIPLNFGLIGMGAFELPFHKAFFLHKNVNLIVYLYNTLSFPNSFANAEDQLMGIKAIRWNTVEFFRALYLNDLLFYIVPFRWYIASGVGCELFQMLRYNNVLKYVICNYPNTKERDFMREWSLANTAEPATPIRPREFEALEQNDGLRQLYIESDTDKPTLGYNQLERFLCLARQNKKNVIVAPFPEPEFAGLSRRRGINVKRIDAHVRRLVESHGMIFIERDLFEHIEKIDKYFIDVVHMGKTGSDVYSSLLAHGLKQYIKHGAWN